MTVIFLSGTLHALPLSTPSPHASHLIQKEEFMSQIAEYNRIVQQAKQRRAEAIGSGLRTYSLPIVAVASLAFATVQFASHHDPDPPVKVQTAELG
jgi:hypothetical protein